MDWDSCFKQVISNVPDDIHQKKILEFMTRLRYLSSHKLVAPREVKREFDGLVVKWGKGLASVMFSFWPERVYWEIDTPKNGFGSTMEYNGHIPKMLEECLKKHYAQGIESKLAL
jgi:hypothetical protein